MNKHAFFLLLISMSIYFGCSGTASAGSDDISFVVPKLNQLTDYPRIEHFEQGSVQVDFPSIESWPDFHFLKAWLPVEVILYADKQPRVGSAYVQAVTDINFDQRTVSISNLKVLRTEFSEENEIETVDQLVSLAFAGRESIVPLDILLRLLPADFEIPDQNSSTAQLNFEPPIILVSETPVRLLSIDGKPVMAPVEGTDIEFVVNTNWNVFYYRADEQWYVFSDSVWQRNNYLSDGGWTRIDKLPADFDKLSLSERWQAAQQSLPVSKTSAPSLPFVISLQATELIQLDGSPSLIVIGEAGISYVSNTQSDLFKHGGRWYFLVSGRWFSSADLAGKWQYVSDLPEAFSQIPSDHEKGHVLFSVPGTAQARLSLIEAALPHRVAVAKDFGAGLEVSWVGEPRFEAIDTTRLERGLNTAFQVIKHNNFYYLCYEGAWYFSDSPMVGWNVARQIPDEIYRIPATDPAYNVTFVRLGARQDQAEAYVTYNYSAGYAGSFSTRVSVVHGTGWHYPSGVYYDPVSAPVYWRYPQTYGYNTGYHPVGAYYGHRAGYYNRWAGPGFYGYGPWGGYGYSGRSTISIESPAKNYSQGYGSAWEGPLQTTPGDPAKADNSLEKFLPAKKVDGTEKFVKTSGDKSGAPATLSASSLYAASALSSNRFAGPGGQVYKREDQQWSQYNDGNWTTMQTMQQNQRTESQSQPGSEPGTTRFVPAHKRKLSRAELDRQELARLEGMDNYSQYRMKKEADGEQ